MPFKSDGCQYCWMKPGQALDPCFTKKTIKHGGSWYPLTKSSRHSQGPKLEENRQGQGYLSARQWPKAHIACCKGLVPKKEGHCSHLATLITRHEHHRTCMRPTEPPYVCLEPTPLQQGWDVASPSGWVGQLPEGGPWQALWKHALLCCCSEGGSRVPHQILILNKCHPFIIFGGTHDFWK